MNQFCRASRPDASVAGVIEKIGNRFRRDVDAFARDASDPGAASGQAGPVPLG